MSAKKNWILTLVGLGLMILAPVPTPDDVTIISPVLMFLVGVVLFTKGQNTNVKIPGVG